MENGEIVEVTDSSVRIFTMDGEPVQRESFEVDWDAGAVELGVFEGLHAQGDPRATRRLAGDPLRTPPRWRRRDLSEVDLTGLEVCDRGCGTSYHAGLLGKYAIERLARIPVEVAVASEYRYADPIVDEKTLVVAISQSGETTDTLAAVRRRGISADACSP